MLQDGEKGVIIQRDKESYAIAPHIPCGVVSPQTLRQIADVAEKYGASALKITSAQRIAIVGIKEEDVDNAWKDLGMEMGAAVGLCVRSIKACPGTTFCKRGQQDSLALGMELDKRYHGAQLPGKLKMGVSGCTNQCAETGFKDLGFIGMPKGWKVVVGGSGGGIPRISQELTRDLSTEEALAMADRVVEHFKANARSNQRLGTMIDKMGGIEEYKKAILG